MVERKGRISRRNFLKACAGAGVSLALADVLAIKGGRLEAAEVVAVEDPIALYPNRGWESVYRDIFREDSSFVFLCAPNDTHNCLLRAHVKNGVVVRISPTFGYGKAKDLYGNQASHRWDPRCCQRGLMLARRFYGDRRVKGPMIRKGFKEWVDAGFPRDSRTGRPRADLTRRGEDEWLSIPWDEAFTIAAKTYINIARTYTGDRGASRLKAQGYDPAMIEAMEGSGVKTLKQRGGMPLLGITRIFGFYRFSNMLALLDERLRKVPRERLFGGRQWDSYSWHTDLPPGHPMVTGHQTVEFDLFALENAKLLVTFGMNWLVTKMPDAHWISEARLRGTKVINVSTDYQTTAHRSDEVIVIRPGTDAGLALGCAAHIIEKKLYDLVYLKERTDLPLLVRMDTKTLLRGKDLVAGRKPSALANYVQVVKDGTPAPAPFRQDRQIIPESLREEWDDFVVWDTKTRRAQIVNRDQVGEKFRDSGLDPALEGEFEVLVGGGAGKVAGRVKCRPVFDLIRQYLRDNFDLEGTSRLTWAPKEAVVALAEQIAANKGTTLLAAGMGPNHFFNADLKDRAIFLLAALTANIGQVGGNVGSYAGNYRGSVFNGIGQWITEDPFDIELDETKPARLKKYYKAESAHYYNYGDRPLRVGNKLFTGETHMPTPTKLMHFGMSNSLLGNVKWHHDVVQNTLPKIEAVFVHDWWWTASCEYADLVFAVDSWAEFKVPDMTGSCTNPFLQVHPRTPLERIHDTRSDLEVLAAVAHEIGEELKDQRFTDYFHFVHENKVEVYLQRILNAGSATRGYDFVLLEETAKQGTPAIMNFRTYPRTGGWEQINESKPWYNRTGRLEFYRDEPEWLEYGENLPVYREPVDGTHREPNVILARPHPALSPAPPEAYGLKKNDLSVEVRQVRNVILDGEALAKSRHPLSREDRAFRFVFLTPKYRWAAHTTAADLDWVGMMFGPFGDIYRHDKRKPWTGEAYLEMNPKDAKALKIEDGDYVWFDAGPEDRPYRDWKESDPYFEVARGMARCRYHNALPPGVTRMWFHMYVSTKGSVRGSKTRRDGLAKNPETNYQAAFRRGSHQSATRAWLRPTLMTDSLVRKPLTGQEIGKGFESDVHCANGAPKESFIKVEKAEAGGIGGKGLWKPAKDGLRAGYESEAMQLYLEGGYIEM